MIGMLGLMGFVGAIIAGVVAVAAAVAGGVAQKVIADKQMAEAKKLQTAQKQDAAAAFKSENVLETRQRLQMLDSAARAIVLNEVHRDMSRNKTIGVKRDIAAQRAASSSRSVPLVNRSKPFYGNTSV